MSRYERNMADPDFDDAEKDCKDTLKGIFTLGIYPLVKTISNFTKPKGDNVSSDADSHHNDLG